MSQFNLRGQSSPPKAYMRDSEVKLRTSPEAYADENMDSTTFVRPHQETKRIQNLSFWDNIDSEDKEESSWTERPTTAPFILMMVILVVASTVLWFLYRWVSGENSNPPPIIPADTTPFKVRPENPGGMMIPYQDKLVYGRLSQDASQPIERLLPPPEQPMIAPQAAANSMAPSYQQPYPSEQTNNMPPPEGYVPHPHPSMQAAPMQPQLQPLHQGIQHPQVEIHSHQPSQSPTPYSPPLPQVPAAEPNHPQIPLQATLSTNSSTQPSAVEDIKPAQDEELEENVSHQEGFDELNQLIAKEAQTPLKRDLKKNAAKLTKPMAIDAEKHKVQIASLPSRLMAEQEMKRLQIHHPSVFEGRPWNIQKINLGPNRGVTYRLIVGSFSNRNAATKFCKKVKSEKIGCLVVGPANE